MRIRVLIAALAAAPFAAAQEEDLAARRGEIGARWWASTAQTKINRRTQGLDPAFADHRSILLYDNLDANTLELFARYNFRNAVFLKGMAGAGWISRGELDLEDFNSQGQKFSGTHSSLWHGRLAYGTGDLGYQWLLRGGGSWLGLFAGYADWTEQYEAYGASAGSAAGEVTRDAAFIGNKLRWRALRLGVAGELALGRLRLSADLAMLPYATVRNEDSHYLRSDLGPVPNIFDKGEGWGAQLEAQLRYAVARSTDFALGARYWYAEVRKGTTTFQNVRGEAPLDGLYTKRAGVTMSLTRRW